MKQLKNFIIGLAISFVIAIISSIIASIFSGYKPADLMNLCEHIVGPFILIFPFYYVYKKSKDDINPNSNLANKYIFAMAILALSVSMVIYSYTSNKTHSGNASKGEHYTLVENQNITNQLS